MSFTHNELLFIKQLIIERQERNRTIKGLIVDMNLERTIAEILETVHNMLAVKRSAGIARALQ
jgi:hypothetical protein